MYFLYVDFHILLCQVFCREDLVGLFELFGCPIFVWFCLQPTILPVLLEYNQTLNLKFSVTQNAFIVFTLCLYSTGYSFYIIHTNPSSWYFIYILRLFSHNVLPILLTFLTVCFLCLSYYSKHSTGLSPLFMPSTKALAIISLCCFSVYTYHWVLGPHILSLC